MSAPHNYPLYKVIQESKKNCYPNSLLLAHSKKTNRRNLYCIQNGVLMADLDIIHINKLFIVLKPVIRLYLLQV